MKELVSAETKSVTLRNFAARARDILGPRVSSAGETGQVDAITKVEHPRITNST